jgi:hypothetical protein
MAKTLSAAFGQSNWFPLTGRRPSPDAGPTITGGRMPRRPGFV